MKKSAFNIPAINNEKEALMQYLKLNSDDANDWNKVKEIDVVPLPSRHRVKIFEYNSSIFHVADNGSRIKAEHVISFNSSLYAIAPQNQQP